MVFKDCEGVDQAKVKSLQFRNRVAFKAGHQNSNILAKKMSYTRSSRSNRSLFYRSMISATPSQAHPVERWQIGFSIDLAASIGLGWLVIPTSPLEDRKKSYDWWVDVPVRDNLNQVRVILDSWPWQCTIRFLEQKSETMKSLSLLEQAHVCLWLHLQRSQFPSFKVTYITGKKIGKWRSYEIYK
jgi:hypothetical protein